MKTEDNFNLKELHFEFDLSKTDYQLDALQNKLLQFYLRADTKFRKAFNTNFTQEFLQFIRDKARMNEPLNLSILGATRGGKTTSKGSKILMANGEWKKVENVQIGEEVLSFDKDGNYNYAKVINKHKFFSENSYEIYQRNKNKKLLYSCTGNHLFPIFHRKRKRIKGNKSKRIVEWEIKEVTAEEHSKKSDKVVDYDYLGITTYSIPKFKGRKNCEIEPYTLGVFLGDGMFNYKQLIISNSKKEIYKEISKYYKIMRVNKKKSKTLKENLSYSYSINGNFATLLKKYNLIKTTSGNKFIPKEALLSDLDYRKKLLAGLIDTDGYRRKNGSLSFSTKSEQLAKNIEFLIYSLGGRCEINKIKKKIKKINFEGEYFNISIYLGKIDLQIPYKVKYKSRKDKIFFYITPNRIAIKTIKVKGKEFIGIELDNNSRWYVTDNYMITHNSFTSISLCAFHQACYNRKFTIDYICGNAYEFLEKLKIMPEDKLLNRIFLIDEEKQAVFSVGSIARKIKLEDVQNIIAINNISTIMLNPYSWVNKNSNYGIRLFGRCFKTKTCRCMLYNLQAGGKGGELPMGILFLPIFTAFLPQEYSEPLEKEYLKKKMDWVRLEQKGEGDVLAEIRKKSAETFMRDKNYLGLTKKNAKIEYIQFKMGSEWTRGEILSIYELTKLMEGGFI
jgi:hypothetical protein